MRGDGVLSMATCTELAHDIFFVVEQRVVEAADVLTFELDIERVHHEFAYTFGGAADDTFVCTRFISRAGAVLRPFDHGHLAVDRHRLGAFDGIGVLAQVGIGNGHFWDGFQLRGVEMGRVRCDLQALENDTRRRQ